MGYSPEIYKQAQAVLEQRRSAAQARAAALRQKLLREVPRLREIEQQMAQSSGKVVSAILKGNDVEKEVERIKAENLALQVEMSMLLREHASAVLRRSLIDVLFDAGGCPHRHITPRADAGCHRLLPRVCGGV